MSEYLSGLSTPEVLKRREEGKEKNAPEQITKTKSRIIRENLFTLFNFLNFLIAALLFAVGAYSNMLFIAIIILNIVIGIAQELKAKKLVDELSILNRPAVTYYNRLYNPVLLCYYDKKIHDAYKIGPSP